MRKFRAAAAAFVVVTAGGAVAADFGTPEEARAMLDRTVAAMTADRTGTIAAINAGNTPEFKDRDLYPFCGDQAGMFVAHGANATLVGQSLKDLKDKAGAALGEQIYAVAASGKDGEVSYRWPRPGETEPTDKVAFVTTVGTDVCAVGYYQ